MYGSLSSALSLVQGDYNNSCLLNNYIFPTHDTILHFEALSYLVVFSDN